MLQTYNKFGSYQYRPIEGAKQYDTENHGSTGNYFFDRKWDHFCRYRWHTVTLQMKYYVKLYLG